MNRAESLTNALIVLASDAAAQLEHLRKLGLPEGVDELALDYDAIAAAADDMLRYGEIDRNQYDAVKKLDSLLSQMSGKAKADLWTPEALALAAEWKDVRDQAKHCLWLLGRGRRHTSTQ